MPKTPKYSIDEPIYLIASARRGFLEDYRITSIRLGPDNIFQYFINIRSAVPQSTHTVGGSRNVRAPAHGNLVFQENELLTFCEAIELAIDYHQMQLDTLTSKRDSKCGTG